MPEEYPIPMLVIEGLEAIAIVVVAIALYRLWKEMEAGEE